MEDKSQNKNHHYSSDPYKQVKIILLAIEPPMLREMLERVLSGAPDMQLVLETDEVRRIPDILAKIHADWLITTLSVDNMLPAPVRTALDENSAVSVVGLSRDGSHAEVHRTKGPEAERENQRYSLDDISLAELLRILEIGDTEGRRD